jgi:hypothetical protein
MKETLYLETTVASYYTARPSNNIFVLARQQITQQWWAPALQRYDFFISQTVIEEAQEGDPEAAQRRLKVIADFPLLDIDEKVADLYKVYIKRLYLPEKAFRDAAHLAVASVHAMDYFVTWNCTHIANGEIIKKVMSINLDLGIAVPVIVTPEELLEV